MSVVTCVEPFMSCIRRRCPVPVLALTLLATGCTPFRPGLPSAPVAREQSTVAMQGEGAVIAREARAQIGVAYRYGGDEPRDGFDCSGLVSYVYAREGIVVPRTAAAQYAASRRIKAGELRPGDLVFFRLVPGNREVTHVGIYTGSGRFVHAPQTGRSVDEASLDDPYYQQRFAGAGRFYADGAGSISRSR